MISRQIIRFRLNKLVEACLRFVKHIEEVKLFKNVLVGPDKQREWILTQTPVPKCGCAG